MKTISVRFVTRAALVVALLGPAAIRAADATAAAPLYRPYSLAELNQHGIPPLLSGIESPAQWELKKAEIRRVWLDYIGPLPARPPVKFRIVAEEQLADHIQRKIVFNTYDGDEIPALLLIPNGLEKSGEKRPGILALHPTNPWGKTSIATAKGMRNRMYAFELVSRGYVVLAPDDLTSGERIYPGHRDFDARPFYEKYPHWSTVGKNITDHLQAVDLLSTLSFVDADRIGVIGHSFGAYNAFFLSSVDPRVKVVVASCGINPFAGNAEPNHWGYRPFPYTHIPKITADLEKGVVPFEFNEIIALSAPRPMFFHAAQSDHLFPHWQSVGAVLVDLHRLYGWLHHEENFVSYMSVGDHDFPPGMHKAAFDFLDHWLQPAK
jgi:dienelactone hydrolase